MSLVIDRSLVSLVGTRARLGSAVLALMLCTGGLVPQAALAQGGSASGLLMSRADLTAAAVNADRAAREDGGNRQRNADLAAAIRQRLRDGDFQVGDRIIIDYQTDIPHRDTLLVRAGREVELPWKSVVRLAGVLRSEARPLLAAEVQKYVKTERVEVTPLMRLGVLGEVARPGYFAFPSDQLISDALMGAGGLTPAAEMTRTIVRRGGQEYRSPAETSQAIARGLTLDQFGLAAGDELVIGQRPEGRLTPTLAIIGGLASIVTVFLALHH
jgi:protein involved in polysaccharide export with SLBB domain